MNLSDPTPAYNLACCFSLKHDIESGIRWLSVAVDLGLDYEDLTKDPDLENMFDHPSFQQIWDRMRNLSADQGQGAAISRRAIERPNGMDPYSATSIQQHLAPSLPDLFQGELVTREESSGSIESPETVFESRLQDGVEAVARGDTKDAICHFTACLKLRPEDAACAYNITCCHALMGEPEPAIDWFRRAVNWGLANVDGLDPARDPDLANLLKNPTFQRQLQELHRRQLPLSGDSDSGDGNLGGASTSTAVHSPPRSHLCLDTSLGARSWAAVDSSTRPLSRKGEDAHPRSFTSPPAGYDRQPRTRQGATGADGDGVPPSMDYSSLEAMDMHRAWGAGPHGLEQNPQEVLGQNVRALLFFTACAALTTTHCVYVCLTCTASPWCAYRGEWEQLAAPLASRHSPIATRPRRMATSSRGTLAQAAWAWQVR